MLNRIVYEFSVPSLEERSREVGDRAGRKGESEPRGSGSLVDTAALPTETTLEASLRQFSPDPSSPGV